MDSKGHPVVDSDVSLRSTDSPDEIAHAYSDDYGQVNFYLGSSTYFAVASKSGYVTNYSATFKSGQWGRVTLYSISEIPTTSLYVKTVDDDAKALYADVVLSQNTSFGSLFVWDEGYSDNSGNKTFYQLPVGAKMVVKATYGDLFGSGNATLNAAPNSLTVVLSARPFFIKAFAYDPIAQKYLTEIPVNFTAKYADQAPMNCSSNGCLLQVKNGFEMQLNASADGYLSSPFNQTFVDGIDSNVTVYLVSLAELSDTYVRWVGLFEPDGQALPADIKLKPGHHYQARLQLFSANATTSGVVFNTTNDEVSITGHDPMAFSQKGGYANACSGSDLKYDDSSQYAWAELEYKGNFSSVIAFNFTVDPQIHLDRYTQTLVLPLSYRSFITQPSGYVRNPYDPVLLNKPDPSNPSGCDVPYYQQNFTIQSIDTTCTKEGCISLSFGQGDLTGSESFTATNQVVLWNEKYKPLYVFYGADLFVPFERASISLKGAAAQEIVWNATTPILGDSTVSGKKQCNFARGLNVPLSDSNFTLDVSGIKDCTNFGLPLHFSGVATLRPLQAGFGLVTMNLSIDSESVNHSSVLTVTGYGVAADDNNIVEARLFQPRNTQADADPFAALSTEKCTVEQVQNAQCEVGALNATYRVTSRKGGSVSVSAASDFLSSPIDSQPTLPLSVSLAQGASTQGTAHFLVAPKEGSGTLSITAESSGASTKLFRGLTVGQTGSNGDNGNSIFPPGWDSCNGILQVVYDPSKNPSFTVGKSCTDLGMRVTSIFPGDAIYLNMSLPEFGQALVRPVETDGSDKCFEICQIDDSGSVFGCQDLGKILESGTSYLVRYNPEMRFSCPKEYKVSGNSIRGSRVKIELDYLGDESARRNVTIHVMNDSSDYSLYISPVLTMYSSTGVVYPQLWAVTNLKQLGTRTVSFTSPITYSVKFTGPGTQVVALNPGTSGLIKAYDTFDLTTPVFDSSSPSSPMFAVSRYTLAETAFLNNVEFNIPGYEQLAQALSLELALAKSENSFLHADAANAVSANAPLLANRTGYWRSSSTIRYCQQTDECKSSYYTLGGCCRDNLEDWKNYTTRIDFTQQSCTFCNDTYNPDCNDQTARHLAQYGVCTYASSSSLFQCDQRCVLKSTLSPFALQSANTIGVTANGVTTLNYGDTSGGKICQTFWSSPVLFVPVSLSTYTYYNPQTPLTSLTDDGFKRCTSVSGCPLVYNKYSVGILGGPASYTLNCTSDDNHDGLWQPGESQTTAIFVPASATGFTSIPAHYDCPLMPGASFGGPKQIIAVSESSFFVPAVQSGNVVPRGVITSVDLQKCQSGYCPMLVNPSGAPDLPGYPICVVGPTDHGFVTKDTIGADQLYPATPTGFGGFDCSGGLVAVSNFCFAGCENYCAQPNCDPSPLCQPNGVSYVPSGSGTKIFNNWLNKSDVIPWQMDARTFYHGLIDAPASFFTDVYQASPDEFQNSAGGKPVFSASYVVVDKNNSQEWSSMSRLTEVKGCGGSDYPYDQTQLPNQGVYTIRDYNTYDAQGQHWLSEANAVEIDKTKYVAAKTDACQKPNWNTRFCETTFVDRSPANGACFNSILQYSQGGSFKPGVDLSLVSPLGDGIKQGIGYGVAPDGQVFALQEVGDGEDTCGGSGKGHPDKAGDDHTHKFHYDYQTLHHWDSLGHYTGQKDFLWKKDLGCSKGCGCKSGGGGYGMILMIVAMIVIMVVAFYAAPAIAPALVSVLGVSTGTATTIAATLITTGLSAGAESLMGQASSDLASAVMDTISTASVGAFGDCKMWQVAGTAAGWACKGILWQITGG